jgi:hypothetical protein
MTRESKNRRRDTFRFSARNQPSDGKYRQERPARPKRPRLNRAIVDRAWELGARPQYPDYRPREDLYRTSIPSTGASPAEYGRSARRTERPSPERYNGRAMGPAAPGRGPARPEADRRSQGAARFPREPGEFSSRQEGRRGSKGAGSGEQRRRGQAPFQRGQSYGGYGSEIESFKNDGHANGVYEYDAPRSGRGSGPLANDGQQPGAAYPARSGDRRGRGGRGRQQDRAFWEEIRQEADQLLGQVTPPANDSRPGQSPRPPRSEHRHPAGRPLKWPTP